MCICCILFANLSIWINDICLKTSLKNNVKALILDTEMSAEEMQFRMISSSTSMISKIEGSSIVIDTINFKTII